MKFVILCQARSGSTLLSEMLDSHSTIHCDGEIFNPKTIQKKWGKIGLYISKKLPQLIVWYNYRKRRKEHYGFKLILGQVNDAPAFIKNLCKQEYILVNLRRQDIIQTAFSACIAKHSNTWYVNNEKNRFNENIDINPDMLFQRIAHCLQQNKLQDQLIYNNKQIYVVYELDLLDKDKQSVFATRICEQLSIPYESLQTNSIKTNERKLSERVTNYDELIAQIKESEYARFIEQL